MICGIFFKQIYCIRNRRVQISNSGQKWPKVVRSGNRWWTVRQIREMWWRLRAGLSAVVWMKKDA